MTRGTVWVVGGDRLVSDMFESLGWTLATESTKLDLICFTGGPDVSPYLYGEENVSSYCDPIRDELEKDIYDDYVGIVPFIGICRGGQFLNVMNGGKMVQDLALPHGMNEREIWDNSVFEISNKVVIHEDHHQGMVACNECYVEWIDPRDGNSEIIWYPDTRSLCFQPHPEWGHEGTKDLFNTLLNQYI